MNYSFEGAYLELFHIVNILPIWSEWFFFSLEKWRSPRAPLENQLLVSLKKKISYKPLNYVFGSYPVMGVAA